MKRRRGRGGGFKHCLTRFDQYQEAAFPSRQPHIFSTVDQGDSGAKPQIYSPGLVGDSMEDRKRDRKKPLPPLPRFLLTFPPRSTAPLALVEKARAELCRWLAYAPKAQTCPTNFYSSCLARNFSIGLSCIPSGYTPCGTYQTQGRGPFLSPTRPAWIQVLMGGTIQPPKHEPKVKTTFLAAQSFNHDGPLKPFPRVACSIAMRGNI